MTKEVVELRVPGQNIFRAFVTKPHFGFSLVKADPMKQTVEIQTSASWFSFGETLRVTVVNLDGAARVIIEARRTMFHNILANPERATAQLIASLGEMYGDKLMLRPPDGRGEPKS